MIYAKQSGLKVLITKYGGNTLVLETTPLSHKKFL